MERGEELMMLNRVAFDRNTQAFERVMAALDRHEQMFEENKLFIRDMNRRAEVVTQQVVRDHQQFMKELGTRDERSELDREKADREREKADRKTDKILVELKDLREESKAQRQALLAMIDRLPPAEAA